MCLAYGFDMAMTWLIYANDMAIIRSIYGNDMASIWLMMVENGSWIFIKEGYPQMAGLPSGYLT